MYRRRTNMARRPVRRRRVQRPVRRHRINRRPVRRRPVRRYRRRPVTRFNHPRSSRVVRRMTAPHLKSGQHILHLTQTEFIQDVYPSQNGTFSIQSFPINIGQLYLPFASTISANYETVEYIDFEFIFKSTSGSALNSVNANLGVVGISYADNVLYTQPQQKFVAEQLEGTVTSAPFRNLRCRFPVRHKAIPFKELYVTNVASANNITGSQDPRMFFPGVFYVWSQGLQQTAYLPIGELWCRYKVVLRHVRGYANQLAYNLLSSCYQLGQTTMANPGSQSAGEYVSNNFTLSFATVGTNFPPVPVNGGTSTSFAGSALAFQFPQSIVTGSYLVNCNIGCPTLVVNGSTGLVFSGTNCSGIAVGGSGSGNPQGFYSQTVESTFTAGQSTGQYQFTHGLNITGPSAIAYYQFPSGNLIATGNTSGSGLSKVLVQQMNGLIPN